MNEAQANKKFWTSELTTAAAWKKLKRRRCSNAGIACPMKTTGNCTSAADSNALWPNFGPRPRTTIRLLRPVS